MEHYFILFSIVLSYLDLESLAGAKKTNKNTLSHLISRGCKRGVTKSAAFTLINALFKIAVCLTLKEQLIQITHTSISISKGVKAIDYSVYLTYSGNGFSPASCTSTRDIRVNVNYFETSWRLVILFALTTCLVPSNLNSQSCVVSNKLNFPLYFIATALCAHYLMSWWARVDYPI